MPTWPRPAMPGRGGAGAPPRLARRARPASTASSASPAGGRRGARHRRARDGVRDAGHPAGGRGGGDQKRVVTPAEAIAAGADYLVVGRPVTGAADPWRRRKAIIVEIEAGAGCGGRGMAKGYWIVRVDVARPGGLRRYVEGQCRGAPPVWRPNSWCGAASSRRSDGTAQGRATSSSSSRATTAALACYRSPGYQHAIAERAESAEVDVVVDRRLRRPAARRRLSLIAEIAKKPGTSHDQGLLDRPRQDSRSRALQEVPCRQWRGLQEVWRALHRPERRVQGAVRRGLAANVVAVSNDYDTAVACSARPSTSTPSPSRVTPPMSTS